MSSTYLIEYIFVQYSIKFMLDIVAFVIHGEKGFRGSGFITSSDDDLCGAVEGSEIVVEVFLLDSCFAVIMYTLFYIRNLSTHMALKVS